MFCLTRRTSHKRHRKHSSDSQILNTFISMNGKIESKVNGVIQTSDIALINTEWSFNGIGPDGKAVTITGKATDVLRRQSDGNWWILIDNPWGTNLQMSV